MLRQLLTLLAVITGLTAAVEPARALETGVARIELAERQANCTPQQGGTVLQIAGSSATQARQAPCVRPAMSVRLPTVMLQADRARE